MEHSVSLCSRLKAFSKAEKCHFCSCLTQSRSFCGRGLHGIKLKRFRKFFFHEDCSVCSISPKELLCQVCQHMRLGHFIRCFDSYTELHAKCHEFSISDFQFTLGSVRGLQERAKDCALCQQFCNSLGQSSTVKSGYEVILAIRQKSDSDPVFGAELTIVDNDEPLSDWRDNADYFYPLDEPHAWVVEPCSMNLTTASNPGLVQHPSGKVDWYQITAWLARCQTTHGECKRIVSVNRQIPRFRVIDVERKCVVLAPPECTYAALSYVWGPKSSADLEAKVSNIKDLEEKGFASQPPLPATIQDAMTACLKIGMPYLWVDRLCILQDATTEKEIQINAMDMIYSNAAITIVMLTGNHVHYGLAGVSGSNRATPTPFATQGIYVAPTPLSFTRAVRNSPWNDRGWTFQEGLLSRRLLFFSDYGVFYECAASVDIEVKTLRKHVSSRDKLFDEPKRMPGAFYPYKTLVERYTTRSFSVQSDIIRAVAGVLNSRFGHDHYFGIPWKLFHRGLMWTTTNGHYLPREAPTGNVFPSWSWSSVVGQIEYDYRVVYEVGYDAPIVLWAYVSTDRLGRAEFHTLPPSPLLSEPGTLGARYLRWSADCFTRLLPDVFKSFAAWDNDSDNVEPRLYSLTSFLRDTYGSEIQQGDLCKIQDNPLSSAKMHEVSQPGRLLAYTQSVQVQIIPFKEGYMKLQDIHGRPVGCLIPKSFDQSRVSHLRVQNPSRYYDLIVTSLFSDPSELFSQSHPYKSGLASETDAPWHDSRAMSPMQGLPGDDLLNTYYVNLMLIENVGGVSKRLGLAVTLLQAWIELDPCFGSFVLS